MKGAAAKLATLFILLVALASASATMKVTSKLDRVHQTPVAALEVDLDLAAELESEAETSNACTSKGGTCFDTTTRSCSVSFQTGLCPGSNSVRCCPSNGVVRSGGQANSGSSSSNNKCEAKKGTCHNIKSNTCSTGFLANLCPGSNDIRCCTGTVKFTSNAPEGTKTVSKGDSGSKDAGKKDAGKKDDDKSDTKVPTGPVKMPSFQILDGCYPRQNVKQMLGGAINADWITNTCAIRMSHTFNCAGDKANSAGLKIAPQGGESIKSANGENHIFRVKQFIPRQLEAKFGKPTVNAYPPKGSQRGVDMQQFKGKKGVLMFDTTGAWASATGHLTLLRPDLTSVESSLPPKKMQEYFDLSINVRLWAAP